MPLPAKPNEHAATAEPRHILVIDDERDLRESVMEALEDAGYSVAGASNGLRALEYLRDTPRLPHLILLDLTMPEMSGIRFREEQRKSALHASIPVAVMSADRDLKNTAANLGVDAVVQKPLKIAALLESVARIFEQRSGRVS